MQKTMVVLLLALTALSGCLNDDADGAGGDETPSATDSDGDGFTDEQESAQGTDPNDPDDAPTPPEALQFEGTLRGAGDGFATGSSTGCAGQDSEAAIEEDPGCALHEVEVPTPGWATSFTLTPGSGTVTMSPDYDLFIYDSSGELLGESTNPGGEVDSWSKKLAAGTYTVKVQAWDNQDAPYTLDVTFAF